MPLANESNAFEQLTTEETKSQPLAIPVTYKHEWQDGFGARGWKLDCALDDPNVIAATAETGCQINTSVLVHDMLDHYISGFPLSGHRNEAMALIQLAGRTGSDPRPDFKQMVDEDLLQGRVSGESFRSFLPKPLVRLLPNDCLSGKEIIGFLSENIGRNNLRTALVNHFFELGKQGMPMASANWHKHGLNYELRAKIGLCLQSLLKQGDKIVLDEQYTEATGIFLIDNHQCALHIHRPYERVISEHV